MSALRRLTVAEIMVKHVVTGKPYDNVSKIAAQMERRKIGSVVIVQNRRVVGILTERDFARIATQGVLQGRDRVKDHMTRPVVTVRSNASLADTVKLMRRKHVRHLPVVDRNKRLVGIVSSRDFMNIAMDIIQPGVL